MSAGAAAAAVAFAALERHHVPWCIWRGSPRLARAFAGESDIDILVDPAHADGLTVALQQAGCRRARTVGAEPPLEDWFLLAEPAGPLLHLHVHYRLVAGEPSHARFRLPFERQVLAARRPLDDHHAVAAAPEHEAALLLLRIALQLRHRDRLLRSAVRRGLDKVRGDCAHLLTGASLQGVAALLRQWLQRDIALPEGADDLDAAALFALRHTAVTALAPFASHTGLAALLVGLLREATSAARFVARKIAPLALPRRGLARGGIVLLVRGGEQQRREAVAARIAAMYGSKFDVVHCHDTDVGRQRALRASARGMIAVVVGGMGAGEGESRWPLGVEPDVVWEVDSPN